jgi:Nucleoside diphosphate kinase
VGSEKGCPPRWETEGDALAKTVRPRRRWRASTKAGQSARAPIVFCDAKKKSCVGFFFASLTLANFLFFSPHLLSPHTQTLTMETTFIMIKPDGVQRGLVGQIIARFEAKGYHLRAMKLQNVPRELAEEHYADLSSKPFFGGLVEYILR